jgi:hypothetical protein
MIQQTMHEWVRHRLHDNGAKQRFSDGIITSALNLGAQEVQARVQAVDPDAFFRTYQRNIQADDYRYQAPRGLLRVRNLWLKYDASATFTEANIGKRSEIDNPNSDLNLSGSGYWFDVTGGEVAIWPTPTQDVLDGFKLDYVPSLGFVGLDDDLGGTGYNDDGATTGGDQDLADYGLVEPLHKGVWLWAVHTLLPNEGDSEGQKLVEYEFEKVMKTVPTYYAGHGLAGGVEFFRVEGTGLELE